METNKYSVYMHITPNNKKYIGITGQEPKKRWKKGFGYKNQKLFYKAILKYGWDNITHIILYKNITKDYACLLEKELIKKYKTNDKKYGYNIANGGEINCGYHHTEKAKQKMSKAKKGVHLINDGSFKKGQLPYNIKAVICIETGQIWNTLSQAQKDMGVSNSYLTRVCKGKAKTCKGLHFKYYEGGANDGNK